MAEAPPQKATQFVETARTIVRIFRYGPREMALAALGVVLLATAALSPEIGSLPDVLQPLARTSWPWVHLVLILGGAGSFVGSIGRIYRKATAPLPDAGGAALPAAIKGASSFGPREGELFSRLGRDHELARLRGWVLDDQVPLVAVMGESGVGKTSLVRSGLGHTLQDDEISVLYWEALPTAPAQGLLHAVRARCRLATICASRYSTVPTRCSSPASLRRCPPWRRR